MIHAIGYAGICLSLPERSISRTVRVANAAPERLRELIRLNLEDLGAILRFNVEQRFCLFRMNQAVIPLISHPANTLAWWDEFGETLRALGDYARTHGLRLSMHPGQYTVLNSENPAVVASSLGELAATCRVFDAMGLPPSHKVVLHGGAGRPEHGAALARLEAAWERLPEPVRTRLILENDDRVFSVAELLPVCRRLGAPLVFDWLHHRTHPGPWADRPVAEIVAEVAGTWGPADGVPKVHFSSQDPEKQPGAHAYWLDAADFHRFRDELAGVTADVKAECKGKDLALIRLREELGWTDLAACTPT
jgi:UV DNA damage endonuclease